MQNKNSLQPFCCLSNSETCFNYGFCSESELIFLAVLVFHTTHFALRAQTLLHATFIFIPVAAIIALIQVVHLARWEALFHNSDNGKR